MNHHLKAEHIDDAMHECIETCSDCHDVCLETLAHSLGGRLAGAEHVKALLDCAQACDASRDFMLRGSQLHHAFCGACAQACERCADDCEKLADDDGIMLNCAQICRRCAESCHRMAAA